MAWASASCSQITLLRLLTELDVRPRSASVRIRFHFMIIRCHYGGHPLDIRSNHSSC